MSEHPEYCIQGSCGEALSISLTLFYYDWHISLFTYIYTYIDISIIFDTLSENYILLYSSDINLWLSRQKGSRPSGDLDVSVRFQWRSIDREC